MENTDNIIREITPLSDRDCFYVVNRRKSEFTYPIHYHEEYELNFVENAPGVRRVVGDSAEIIGDYDLVLITGKNLEHAWEQHDCTSKDIREITIQFAPDLISPQLRNKNQFASIVHMLNRAQCGLSFPLQAVMKVYNQLEKLATEEQGFYAVQDFLSILYELSLFEDARTFNEHFRKEIRLVTLAEMVGMTPVSFSRFFRLRTGKTLSEYIIDIRLGAASRLLVDSTRTVAEICYDCGFNNLSNFNRMFKRKKGCAPKEFRENYHKKKIII